MNDDQPIPSLPPVDPASAGLVPGADLSPELLASLLADGDDELAAWTLSQAISHGTRSEVFDGLLRDAMRLVGDRWATGRWSIAEEHLASRTLLRALEQVRPEQGPESRIGPIAVLASVSGEHHMIGLVCLEQVLAEAGWTTANLGADLPARDLGRFVERNEVALVALSVVDGALLPTLAACVTAVREADPAVRILVGGPLAGTEGFATSVGADWAGTSVRDAVAFARSVYTGIVATD